MLDWERNWRGAGVVFALLIIIASIIYGSAPLISRIVLVAWIAVISGFLYMRSPSTVKVPDRAAVPTA